MTLVLSAPTLDGVLELAQSAAEAAQQRVEAGELGGYDAVTRVLPPLEQQQAALAWLAEERAGGGLDAGRILATVESSFVAEGLRVEPFRAGLGLLARALQPSGPVTREAVLALPQGAQLLDRYLKQTAAGWTSVVKVYKIPGRPKREVPQAALDLAASLGEGAQLTGINVLSRSLRGEIRRDAVVSAVIGLVLVALLLWGDFRDLRACGLALLPLALGIVWMIGAMVVLGLHMNFMNIFVITMIIGIGVDYGIHVLHRYREEAGHPEGDVRAALEETVRGVALAALTTMVGFGSLATSHYPGLVSMGAVAILGTVATGLVAIAVVPAWISWRRHAEGLDRL